MLKNWRKLTDKGKTKFDLLTEDEKRHNSDLKNFEAELEILKQTREIFQKASLITQNHLAEHLSNIVTKALRAVFYEKNITFITKFTERRNTTECDFFLEEDGELYSLLDSRGYGMADIASFALRVSYILLNSGDNVLVIDEPFRNLSRDKHEIASQMIKELSKELNIQFIISTHMELLKEYADKSFEITQKDKISKCY